MTDTGNFRSADAERLAIVTRTLCLKSWDNKHLDRDLLYSLDGCLEVLEAVACVARYVREEVTLTRATPRSGIPDSLLARLAHIVVAGPYEDDGAFYHELDDLHVIGIRITEPAPSALAGSDRRNSRGLGPVVGYAALCFKDSSVPKGLAGGRMIAFHSRCTAPLLWQVLQQRVRVFLPVSPRAAERYWHDATRIRDAHTLVLRGIRAARKRYAR